MTKSILVGIFFQNLGAIENVNMDMDEGISRLTTSTPLAPTQLPTDQTSKSASAEAHRNNGSGGESSGQENGRIWLSQTRH